MTAASFLARLLTLGGDSRITVPRGQNTNRYGASPHPRSTSGYSSSTANDISLAAFGHLDAMMPTWPESALSDPDFYAERLEALRGRLRQGWQLPHDTEIVFAPSGTDLEYVALALAGGPATNVLIDANEVGSGCILSAAGRYYAESSAVDDATPMHALVEGLEGTELVHLPMREPCGSPRSSASITRLIDKVAEDCRKAGRQCLVHMVYGSKTGLMLPHLADLDRIRGRHPDVRFVVDACQARIASPDLQGLLARGCMVLLTGSKFIGGPPFSGMAVMPADWAPRAPVAAGLGRIFRRGEWPASWSGCDRLPSGANPGLLLRLEAALFELERFLALDPADVERVIASFGKHVSGFADRLGAGLLGPSLRPDGLHTSTLATLDLTSLPSQPDLAVAQRWNRVLSARGLRLGQPVKCVSLGGGRWGGTLRLSLSMPLIGELSKLAPQALDARLERDMNRIHEVLAAAQRGAA